MLTVGIKRHRITTQCRFLHLLLKTQNFVEKVEMKVENFAFRTSKTQSFVDKVEIVSDKNMSRCKPPKLQPNIYPGDIGK